MSTNVLRTADGWWVVRGDRALPVDTKAATTAELLADPARIGDKVKEEAERQWYDPAVIQQAMLEVEQMRESGQMSDADADALEEDLLQRLLEGSGRPGGLDVTEEWT